MRLSLTSEIVLNKIPERYYNPQTAVERSEITRAEKISTDIFPLVEEGVRYIVDELEKEIIFRQQNNKQLVLALGTGTSLTPVFEELINRHKAGLSLENVVVFNAYEYFPLNADSQHSSIVQLKTRFLNHVDIKDCNVFTLDGTVPQPEVYALCRQYEQQIEDMGGIDFTILGIGRMGNIATNEPGSSLTSPSRIILLGSVAREEMTNSFGSNEAVPPCSITMGISTILSSKKVFLVAWGEEKASIIQKTIEENFSDTVPASFLQTHKDVHVVLDLGAASRLTRIIHPWLVTSCEWNDKLVRSALVWLCEKKGKPILKLTNKDYNENGLSELLAVYGSAYNANIKVFNDLQRTITGWPGGKPNADDTYRPERANPYPKRVIVFSPHPDDDVISMGGTLRRLVEQGHDVHVAFQTSGNIAVGDEEVTRFMHFINGFNQLFGGNEDNFIKKKYQEIKAFLATKIDAEGDNRDILTIKGLIRRGEARTALTFNEIPLDHIHFLDLPFYESGKIEKLPMTEIDVKVVQDFIHEIQPHQIYVAGDLADPHGTHKKCTDAVFAAIDEELKNKETWLDDCRVWMYRGAWAEWEIENIEMCVPISPEELRRKRVAILKHQSQMESAPFLGNDERLFWQRSEDRNHATAELYHRLGLACYEAMEAFVEYKFKEM